MESHARFGLMPRLIDMFVGVSLFVRHDERIAPADLSVDMGVLRTGALCGRIRAFKGLLSGDGNSGVSRVLSVGVLSVGDALPDVPGDGFCDCVCVGACVYGICSCGVRFTTGEGTRSIGVRTPVAARTKP